MKFFFFKATYHKICKEISNNFIPEGLFCHDDYDNKIECGYDVIIETADGTLLHNIKTI